MDILRHLIEQKHLRIGNIFVIVQSTVNVTVSHLQCEDANDGLVVTDAKLHVAGVQVLPDPQRVLLILLQLLDLLH